MIIYSNIGGSYLLDSKSKIVDSILFDTKEVLAVEKKLKDGDWLDSELKLAKKNKGKELQLLGRRNGKQEDIVCFNNSKLALTISEALRRDKKISQRIYDNNIFLTKKAVKESVEEDLLIIQSIKSIDELKLIVAKLSQRLREWYELYNPEFSRSVSDHNKFAELILKKSRKDLLKEVKVKEEESMGADLKKEQVKPILDIAKKLRDIFDEIEDQEKYLEKMMEKRCPNIVEICGSLIGAKLIELAGSLEELARYPSSTVQLLGAEKALFRHLRGGNKAPKHGIIVTHPVVSKAKNKGRSARIFANKISIAAKVDFNRGKFVGKDLKKDMDKKLKDADSKGARKK